MGRAGREPGVVKTPGLTAAVLAMPAKIFFNPIILRSLLRAPIKWGIQRGRASPLVACGVNTPYAKCSVYSSLTVELRLGVK